MHAIFLAILIIINPIWPAEKSWCNNPLHIRAIENGQPAATTITIKAVETQSLTTIRTDLDGSATLCEATGKIIIYAGDESLHANLLQGENTITLLINNPPPLDPLVPVVPVLIIFLVLVTLVLARITTLRKEILS